MNRTLLYKLILPALLAAGCLLTQIPAKATAILSDTLTVCVNGQNCQYLTASEGHEDEIFTFDLNIGNSNMLDDLFHGVINSTVLLEPDGGISDIFGVRKVNNGSFFNPDYSYELYFISDPGPLHALDILGHLLPDDLSQCSFCVPEGNGGPFDLGNYLSADAVQAGYSATFTSDSESTVPEPGSIGVVLGMASLGLIAWKRRRTAASS